MRCKKTLLISGLMVSVLLLALSFPVVLTTNDGEELNLEDSVEWGGGHGDMVECVSVEDVDDDSVNEIVTVGMIWRYTPQNKRTEYTMFGQVRIWTWDGTAFKLEAEREWEDMYVWAVFVADVDNDSAKEIIASTLSRGYDEGGLYVWQWNGSILFEEASEEWKENIRVHSIKTDNIDDDPAIEIITGGDRSDGLTEYGQLRVWDLSGSYLNLKASVEWGNKYESNFVKSVSVSDIDEDSCLEIITGGSGPYPHSKLMIWALDNGTLNQRAAKDWKTMEVTSVLSVFAADVNGDFRKEILTGGSTWDGDDRLDAQLRVWSLNGTNLTLEASQDWHTVGLTSIGSVFAADIDSDGETEIITAGKASDREPYWIDDTCFAGRDRGQIRIWVKNQEGLELRRSVEWLLGDFTRAYTTCVSDVNGDGTVEVITGGTCGSGAQLAIWRWGKASTVIPVNFLAVIAVAGITALTSIIFWRKRAHILSKNE